MMTAAARAFLTGWGLALLALIAFALTGCGLMTADPAQRRRDFVRECINSEGPHMEAQCRQAARDMRP